MIALFQRCPSQRAVLTVTALVFAAVCGSSAQSTASKPPASGSSSASGTGTGFAIESEMLTYTAMDSQAQGLACGIARNLGVVDERCSPRASSGPGSGIVVVASPSSALSEFQLWRADISSMKILTLRANQYCPQNPRDRGATAPTSLGSQILSMFPGGQALSFAQTLLSTSSESNPVEGNVADQTLVADIAGHLRALGLSVVIPDTYMPHSLSAVDSAHSPFLSNLAALLKARDCLFSSPPKKEADHTAAPDAEHPNPGAEKEPVDAEKQAIAQAIDAFLKSLSDPHTVPATQQTAGAAAPAPQPVMSHLSAVLRADGLAQELGSASADGQSGENSTWYLLWLKALESGGTVAKTGNAIMGNKTNFSGGAVGTYSLFRLSGNVVCSGVFYNYAGPMQMTQIAKLLKGTADAPPAGRLVGGCASNQ
jgi:hypothetical protein